MRIGRALITTVAAAAVVGAASAAAIGFGGDPARTPTSSARPPSTAPITRTTLYDREKHDGTLGHGTEKEVSGRLGGTVTWLPDTGAVVQRGQALYRVDDKPVLLLYGALPAYRELRSGSEGADVRQLETELRALGYTGFTVDDEYTSATADAVEDWQDDLGLRETGTVTTSQIAYAAGPVRIDSHSAETGAVVQPGTELFKITGTTLVATVKLDMDAQRLARKGATVRVTMPDGKVVPGKITAVETVVESGQGDEEDTTRLAVTIGFGAVPRGWDAASVTVDFTASERKGVLTVPVSALLALAEGGYGLQLVEGGSTRIIAVRTGLFADGKVEVSGTGLTAGMRVGMPS